MPVPMGMRARTYAPQEKIRPCVARHVRDERLRRPRMRQRVIDDQKRAERSGDHDGLVQQRRLEQLPC